MTDDPFHRRRIRNERASRGLDIVGDALGCILVLLLAMIGFGPVLYVWRAG
jgi:hypothetical protein